jgi:tetratricopeptide (TPR) repeat protein
MVEIGSAQYMTNQLGRPIDTNFTLFINRLKQLINGSGAQKGWNINSLTEMKFILGTSYLFIAENGQEDQAATAADILGSTLNTWKENTAPIPWAFAQCNLAVALRIVGSRETTGNHLQEAIDCYHNALRVFTKGKQPLLWAAVQFNLGAALETAGERNTSTVQLEQAVVAEEEALRVFSRKTSPLVWATAQHNLGNSLMTLGQRDPSPNGTQKLREAINHYNYALLERTRSATPLYWAETEDAIGVAYLHLGERGTGTEDLTNARDAIGPARAELDSLHAPFILAKANTDMGIVLQLLGERDSNVSMLREAIKLYQDALSVRTQAAVPFDWAVTIANLGNASRALGYLTRDGELICEALMDHFEASMQFARSAPGFASMVESAIVADIQADGRLQYQFGKQGYRACLKGVLSPKKDPK